MTTEEKYPNFAKLTALLNQQKHPRRTLMALVALMAVRPEDKAQAVPGKKVGE